MTALTALVSLGAFIGALWFLGIARAGAGVLATARGALAVLRDPALDDDAREAAVQRAALSLFAAFFSILGRSLLALAISFLPVWLAGLAGLTSHDAVLSFLARWDVIALASLATLSAYFLWTRLWASS
jgi:hypothetical protein